MTVRWQVRYQMKDKPPASATTRWILTPPEKGSAEFKGADCEVHARAFMAALIGDEWIDPASIVLLPVSEYG